MAQYNWSVCLQKPGHGKQKNRRADPGEERLKRHGRSFFQGDIIKGVE